MTAPGTSGLFRVAMVRHELRCGEVVDVGHPLGGVWHVAARSVHDGLPEEKGWERQYKSDRLTCPDRMQNRCYSVTASLSYEAAALHKDECEKLLRDGKLATSSEGKRLMMSCKLHTLTWCISAWLVGSIVCCASAQQTTRSDLEVARQGAIALAAAHSEKPRYGGTFLSAGNEEIPFYDPHQTSLGGVYAAVAPAYNCLIRTSPYDPMALDIMPELAETWESSDGGKTLTFHLHKGVQWHDGMPFSSADVQYTSERIMHPPKGMVSPRGPIFAALIARVETPDPHTVVIHGKGPSGLLLPLFANGWNVIIPKHIAEKDPVNALKTTVIGTGPFRLKEPPTSSLWKYERNKEYFRQDLPFLEEIEIHLITDPQALVTALLGKRVFWSDSFPHPNMDRDLSQSATQQNPHLVRSSSSMLIVEHLTMQTEKPPFDDLRVRQAISEALRREAFIELGTQSGAVGTGNYPFGPWGMPT